jgi:hypothetical protein
MRLDLRAQAGIKISVNQVGEVPQNVLAAHHGLCLSTGPAPIKASSSLLIPVELLLCDTQARDGVTSFFCLALNAAQKNNRRMLLDRNTNLCDGTWKQLKNLVCSPVTDLVFRDHGDCTC